MRVLVGDELFSIITALQHDGLDNPLIALQYRYFHRKCLGEEHSLIPTIQASTVKTRHSVCIVASHTYSHRIAWIRCKLHHVNHCSLVVAPKMFFPDQCNHNLFKSSYNRYTPLLSALIASYCSRVRPVAPVPCKWWSLM